MSAEEQIIVGESPPRGNWFRILNPFRVGLVIVVGVLVIYTALLWRKLEDMEREVHLLRIAQTDCKVKTAALYAQMQAIQHRLPMQSFLLRSEAPDEH